MSAMASVGYAPVPTQETTGILSPSSTTVPISPTFFTSIGLDVIIALNSDAKRLFLSKSVRLFSFGFLSVILVVYLQEIGLSERDIGVMFMLTLVGDMLISLYLTGVADRVGRRNCLLLGSCLSFGTGFIFASQSNFWLLLVAAIFGVISPSGNEVGPFLAIEVSSLAHVTPAAQCTLIMAWYNLFGSFSSGIGALFCGIVVQTLKSSYNWTLLDGCRLMMYIYAVLQLVKGLVFYSVSPAVEVTHEVTSVASPSGRPFQCCSGIQKSRGIVFKLSALFCLDSFAGAFVMQSFISAWFVATYNADPDTLGLIVFICNLVAGISALFAVTLANQIGLIMTMAVTHLPSNVLLILVPLMPNEKLAMAMLCLRYCISQMDVPTRNAYVSGVVAPEERSASQGVTNVVRSLGVSVAPVIAAKLYTTPSDANYPFFIAGGLKIIYDLCLLGSFYSVKTEHEKVKAAAALSTSADNDGILMTIDNSQLSQAGDDENL
jgi:predicted MFS family arabinose efflux permease